MTLPSFLTQTPDGEIRLTRHRIGLYHLVERYNDGDSAEMIASRYSTLPLALVHRVIAFYLENRSEVDAYMAACSSALEEQRAAAPPLDLDALRDRLSMPSGGSAAATPQAG
jgi:uncharacterized protein (DUF433 family)